MDKDRKGGIDITGDEGETIHVDPDKIHIIDGDSEIKLSWTGLRIRDGETKINLSPWKPLLGCALAILLFVALLTTVIVGIVKIFL